MAVMTMAHYHRALRLPHRCYMEAFWSMPSIPRDHEVCRGRALTAGLAILLDWSIAKTLALEWTEAVKA